LQLTTFLAETLKSGKIVVSQNNKEAVEIKAENKKIDVNAKDKAFVKEIISSVASGNQKGARGRIEHGIDGLRAIREIQPLVKDVAEDFCRQGVTVTISYRGDKVVTIGSGANSKFTRFLTGTKGIEVNSPQKLIEMSL
jgi:hypothetical protein